MEHAHQIPSLSIDLLDHPFVLLLVEAVGDGAPVLVGHGVEALHRDVGGAASGHAGQEPAGFIRKLPERVVDHGLADVLWDLDHRLVLSYSSSRRTIGPSD